MRGFTYPTGVIEWVRQEEKLEMDSRYVFLFVPDATKELPFAPQSIQQMNYSKALEVAQRINNEVQVLNGARGRFHFQNLNAAVFCSWDEEC